MASVSVSHLILFIASLVIAAGVVGTMTTGVERVNGAIQDNSLDVSQQLRTDVTVISDAGSDVYNNSSGDVTLLVKNTGTQPFPANERTFDVLFDGRYASNVTVEPVSPPDAETWRRNDVVELRISVGDLAPGDYRVKLVVYGDEEVFSFRVSS